MIDIKLIFGWFWENYGRAIADTCFNYTQIQIARFNWSKATKQYCQQIEKDHCDLRILGKSDPTPLEDIYTDVYILDKITAQQRFNEDNLKAQFTERFYDRPERQRGLDLIKRRPADNFFILGKPRAGKTTFLWPLNTPAT